MIRNRYFAALAMAGLVSFAACGGDEAEEGADTVTQDTIGVPGTATVEVPTTDTAVVTTEMSVDTSVDVDTSHVAEGQPKQ